jgi:hypothetical protein
MSDAEIIYPDYPKVEIVPYINKKGKQDGYQLKVGETPQPVDRFRDLETMKRKKDYIIRQHVNYVVFLYLYGGLVLGIMNRYNFSQATAVSALQYNFHQYGGRSVKDASIVALM